MQQVIKLTSFGTYKQKIGAGVHLALKIKQKVYKIAVEYHRNAGNAQFLFHAEI